jgi:hypothetical protein
MAEWSRAAFAAGSSRTAFTAWAPRRASSLLTCKRARHGKTAVCRVLGPGLMRTAPVLIPCVRNPIPDLRIDSALCAVVTHNRRGVSLNPDIGTAFLSLTKRKRQPKRYKNRHFLALSGSSRRIGHAERYGFRRFSPAEDICRRICRKEKIVRRSGCWKSSKDDQFLDFSQR